MANYSYNCPPPPASYPPPPSPYYPMFNYYPPPTPSANYSNTSSSEINWHPNTAANYYIPPDIQSLSIAAEYQGSDNLQVENGVGLSISHTGTITIPSPKRYFMCFQN